MEQQSTFLYAFGDDFYREITIYGKLFWYRSIFLHAVFALGAPRTDFNKFDALLRKYRTYGWKINTNSTRDTHIYFGDNLSDMGKLYGILDQVYQRKDVDEQIDWEHAEFFNYTNLLDDSSALTIAKL